MKSADYTRASFTEVEAPWDQKCSCECGQKIKRGQTVFARPFVNRGKVTGQSRLVSMEHYDDWFENVAHAYAGTIQKRHPELTNYFER